MICALEGARRSQATRSFGGLVLSDLPVGVADGEQAQHFGFAVDQPVRADRDRRTYRLVGRYGSGGAVTADTDLGDLCEHPLNGIGRACGTPSWAMDGWPIRAAGGEPVAFCSVTSAPRVGDAMVGSAGPADQWCYVLPQVAPQQFIELMGARCAPIRLSQSCFCPAYGLAQLRQDLERFVFLLGGSDGEQLFGP